jgi:hypothetical protein
MARTKLLQIAAQTWPEKPAGFIREDMSGNEQNRRAPGATRIPFEALVEVGGALGPTYEAQAVDISQDGMHLRTAYLPEIGQPISCRFDAAGGQSVLATGEVVWKQEAGKGGEFGIRFTGLDAASAEALAAMMNGHGPAPASRMEAQPRGAKVRLHIEGLQQPMRARVKDSTVARVTAFSELGFLQVGKPLELEDAGTGNKRPAIIDRVECEMEPGSRVPHLVVSLRYDDEDARTAIASEPDASPPKERTPEPVVTHEDDEEAPATVHAHARGAEEPAEDDAIERASGEMRGFVARTATKVTPALSHLMNRAKTTIAVLAAKRRGGAGDDAEVPARRVTSPPPQGGLHASGRKVVRETTGSTRVSVSDAPPKTPLVTKKRALVATGAVGLAVIASIALHKPSAPASGAAGATNDMTNASTAPLVPTTAEAPLTAPPSVLQPVTTAPSPAGVPATPSMPTPAATTSLNATASTNAPTSEIATNDVLSDETTERHGRHHPTHVQPFSNGPVSHGTVLKLKMDGPIEKIEGDAQPTGFTVVLPGRKSLEPASGLASRDSRIHAIRVSNDGSGAELTVDFKDGVPNYLVRARGEKNDVLEIVLGGTGGARERDRDEARPRTVSTAPSRRHHRRH